MSDNNVVAEHYTHGDLLGAITAAVHKLGKTPDSISIEDLAPVDEFHIGGRVATDHLLDQLNFSGKDHILDIGCGLGGAARFIASRHGNKVSGIDLTPEYVETGKALCDWVGLGAQVSLHQGSAIAMPFEDAVFDGAVMLHVGMNIEDKAQLFAEVSRVLKPGASFGIYDVMRTGDGDLVFPVPWATTGDTSKLATPSLYANALKAAGFIIGAQNVRREFALEFFRQLKAKTEANGGPPPLGLHTLMQASTPVKIKNMIDNIVAGLIAPVELIVRRPQGGVI